MAFHNNPRTITNGLILCLDANAVSSYSGSGSTWTDLARTIGNATLTSYTYNSDGGQSNFVFSGSGMAQTSSYDLSGGYLTMEIIYKLTTAQSSSLSTYGRMFKYSDTVISIGSYATNQFRCWVNAGGSRMSGEFSVNSSTSRFYDNWHHVAFTYDGSNVKGYWDNNNAFSVAKTGALQSSATIQVGNGDSNLFPGSIAVAKIYDRALSAVEVDENFKNYSHRFQLVEATSIS